MIRWFGWQVGTGRFLGEVMAPHRPAAHRMIASVWRCLPSVQIDVYSEIEWSLAPSPYLVPERVRLKKSA